MCIRDSYSTKKHAVKARKRLAKISPAKKALNAASQAEKQVNHIAPNWFQSAPLSKLFEGVSTAYRRLLKRKGGTHLNRKELERAAKDTVVKKRHANGTSRKAKQARLSQPLPLRTWPRVEIAEIENAEVENAEVDNNEAENAEVEHDEVEHEAVEHEEVEHEEVEHAVFEHEEAEHH